MEENSKRYDRKHVIIFASSVVSFQETAAVDKDGTTVTWKKFFKKLN